MPQAWQASVAGGVPLCVYCHHNWGELAIRDLLGEDKSLVPSHVLPAPLLPAINRTCEMLSGSSVFLADY